MKSLILKIFLLKAIFVSFSYADCDPGNISILSLSPSVIDFRLSNQVITTFQITHQPFTGSNNCYYFNDLSYGAAASFLNRELNNITTAGNTINFNTYSALPVNNNTIIRLAEEATQNSHVIYQNTPFSPSASTQVQSRTFISELGTIPVNSPPGIYTESLIFRLRSRDSFPPAGDYSSFQVSDTRAVQLIYEIPKVLDISLVNSGDSFDENQTSKLMSFTNLQTGNSMTASVIIQTNVGYRLILSSTNDGLMQHNSTSATIPYTMTVSGSIINLGSSSTIPVEVSSQAGSSPSAGFTIPLNVTIGTIVGNEIGGRYSDIIAMTIQAF